MAKKAVVLFSTSANLALLSRLPAVILRAGLLASIGAAVIYAGSIVGGIAAGFGLPTTALMRWSSAVRWCSVLR